MLRVKNINYSTKDRTILSNISFDANPGEVIAITGPNGAGKSTLIKILSRELDASSGDISWEDTDIEEFDAQSMAIRRAVLNQQVQVSSDFCADEIVMMGRYMYFKRHPSSADTEIVKETMEVTETSKFHGEDFKYLSGGEKQRVHLARVLAQLKDPENEKQCMCKMMLLDEPLNNLDVRHQHKCLNIAQDLGRKGNVVIMVIHDLNMAARYADKILLLKQGKILAFDKSEAVINKNLLESCYDFPVNIIRTNEDDIPFVFFSPTETLKTTV